MRDRLLAKLLRTSIGVQAESQIQELFCLSVKFDHKISISVASPEIGDIDLRTS